MSGLITNPVAIWLAVAPVDMRRGIDGLSMLVQQALGQAPCSGAAFVFRNRSGNRIKVLFWDGTGVVVVPGAGYMKGDSFGLRSPIRVFQ
jgi:transposase